MRAKQAPGRRVHWPRGNTGRSQCGFVLPAKLYAARRMDVTCQKCLIQAELAAAAASSLNRFLTDFVTTSRDSGASR